MLDVIVLTGCGAGAGYLLRRSWRRRDCEDRKLVVASTWTALLAVGAGGMQMLGAVIGLATAVATMSLGLLAIVLLGRTSVSGRGDRLARVAPEPPAGPSRIRRGISRAVLTGPLALAAATALTACGTLWISDPRTRLVVAAILLPILWAAGMIWPLSAQRLGRPALALTATTIAGFGLVALDRLA